MVLEISKSTVYLTPFTTWRTASRGNRLLLHFQINNTNELIMIDVTDLGNEACVKRFPPAAALWGCWRAWRERRRLIGCCRSRRRWGRPAAGWRRSCWRCMELRAYSGQDGRPPPPPPPLHREGEHLIIFMIVDAESHDFDFISMFSCEMSFFFIHKKVKTEKVFNEI